LFPGEIMQVPGVGRGIVFPGIAVDIEEAPSGGRFSSFGVPPVIVITVGAGPRASGLPEPCMFVAAVIDDEVHDEADIAAVHLAEQGIEIGHCSEILHDIPVIADIIAIVIIRGRIDGIEPDHVDAEAFDIVEFGDDAFEIADTVAIIVFEAAGVDLVNDCFLPPFAFGVGGVRGIRSVDGIRMIVATGNQHKWYRE
jgi:hypothetical protein